jgi:hypothetical protein
MAYRRSSLTLIVWNSGRDLLVFLGLALGGSRLLGEPSTRRRHSAHSSDDWQGRWTTAEQRSQARLIA